MKKRRAIPLLLSLSMAAALLLSSCSEVPGQITETSSSTDGSVSASEIIDSAQTDGMDFSFSGRDENTEYDENSATEILFSDNESSVTGKGAAATGADVTITAAGTYLVKGSAPDATLTIDAAKTDKIQLVFDGVSISCTDGPAVYIKCADKVFITLADGSENFLSDGDSYEIVDDGSTLDAALFSKEDLTINGSGSLTVNGNYKHGIVSKDDLVITGGIITITSVKAGIDGKDCVKIGGGTIRITAGSDGIRSSNDEDTSRGYIYISGGTIDITAGNDGIQAETVLNITGGEFTIESGGGSANASTSSDGGWNSGWGSWGGFGGFGGTTQTTADEASAKGLKAGTELIITDGTFSLDSSDDSIHSNGNIAITNGIFSLLSGDRDPCGHQSRRFRRHDRYRKKLRGH